MSNLAPILHNHVFCCTGLSVESKTLYQKKIEALGGKLEETVSEACHCLLGNPETILQSPKYLYALNANIPVIQVAWIDECWQHVHISSATPTDQLKYLIQLATSKFIINGLMGCKISVSGFALEERARLRDLIHSLRGSYCPDLTSNCTHLILSATATVTPASTGLAKVEMAGKWSIPVVSVEWLYACETQKRLIDWQSFAVSDSGRDTASLTAQDHFEVDENCQAFLSGCHIYLHPSAPLHLKRLILAAGGVRHTDPTTPLLTHALIHQQIMSAELPKQLPEGVKIVHDGWVMESFRAQQRLPEDGYMVSIGSALGNSTVNNSFSNATVNNSFFNLTNNSFTASFSNSFANTSQLLSTPTIVTKRSLLTKQTTFSFHAYPRQPEATLARLKKLLSKAKRLGISVVSKKGDFSVMPCVISGAAAEMIAENVITDVLFEGLLDALKLDPSTSVALTPALTYAHPVQMKRSGCLNGCVFSQTGFTGPAREFNAALVQAAGAQYTDALSQRNTHLIVDDSSATGIKREFAKKWGIAEVGVREVMAVIRGKGELLGAGKRQGMVTSLRVMRPALPLVSAGSIVGTGDGTGTSAEIPDTADATEMTAEFTVNTQQSQPNQSAPSQQSHQTTNQQLFKGLVFAMSQRLRHRRDHLTALLDSHGASVLYSLTPHCTHYLHQGNQAEECFREFKQARGWGIKIVNAGWVEESVREGRLMDERLYPHTLKTGALDKGETGMIQRESTGMMQQQEMSQSQSRSHTHIHSQSQSQSYSQSQSNSQTPSQPSLSQAQQNSIDWNAIVREREERAAQLRPRGNIDFSSFAANIGNGNGKGNTTMNVKATSIMATANALSTNAPSTNAPSINPPSANTLSNPLYFIFSGFTAPQKESLRSQLPPGALVTEAPPDGWAPQSSLLVVADGITASEKFFSACASGSWVLRKEFITEYLTSLRQLNDLINAPLEALESYEVPPSNKYGAAARHWRRRGGRAFAGWRVFLNPAGDEKKVAQFRAILSAGGAEFVEVEQEATHNKIELNLLTSFILNPK